MDNSRLFAIFEDYSTIHLRQIMDSIEVLESGLDSKLKGWSDWYEKETESWSEEEKSFFVDHHYDDLATIRDLAPNMLRTAMFVCLMGCWEVLVADLCRFLHRTDVTPRKPKQKLYIERSKNYLIEIAGFSSDVFDANWEFCEKASCVRHIVLHNNNRVPTDAQGEIADMVKQAQDLIRDTCNIEISPTRKIQIQKGFCELVALRIKDFVNKLLQEAKNRYFND